MPARDPEAGYVAELDGLRGIAILLVMVHRMFPRAVGTPWPVEAGWAGVDLFFVISGFLIAGILIDTRTDPDYFRNFYARRVLRIFPLFYLLVGGMLLAFPLASHGAFLEQAGSPLWYLLQLGNLPEALLGRDPPYWLAPVWSLAIEEQFYLTFPLVVRFCEPRRLGRVLVGVALFALAMRLVTTQLVPDRERVQYLFTLCRLDTIAIGCLLAVVVRSPRYALWRPRLPRLLAPVLAGCAVTLLVTQLDRTTWFGRTFGYDVVALGFGALVLLVLERRDRPATAVLRFAPLRYLGKLCFGLYLLHRPADTIVSAVVARTGLDGDALIWLPVKLAVAVALATASWRLLERPFLKLKRRFTSRAHPLVPTLAAALLIGCSSGSPSVTSVTSDASQLADAGVTDASAIDAREIAIDAAITDARPAPLGRVLYPEDALLSPLPRDVADGLDHLAGATSDHGFAKIGDSMTAATSFLTCFDANPDLGAHADLAATRSFFATRDAAGVTPYARTSLAATGGWTTTDELTGDPPPLLQELAATTPRYGVILLGTNDVRYGHAIEAFACDLWDVVDHTIARGTIPILSTMPAMHGDPGATARIPLFNRVIRAIAQGRGVPLVDLHLALAALPEDGLGPDGIHPTAAPEGACALTSTGLGYGYNQRNLLTLEALDRTRRACSGETVDASAPRRAGAGSHAAPYRAKLPVVDLADTRTGEAAFAAYPSCGVTASGHELVYRLDLTAATTIDAYAIGRAPVAAAIAILDGTLAPASCVAGSTGAASATVGPGPVFVVVDSPTTTTEGELIVVVQPR